MVRENLVEYLQGPSKSRLDKDELKDAILFFVSLQQDKELVDCGARGRQTNKPIDEIMDKGRGRKQIQRCDDGTVYGRCSERKPLFCANTLRDNCARCGCNANQTCGADNSCRGINATQVPGILNDTCPQSVVYPSATASSDTLLDAQRSADYGVVTGATFCSQHGLTYANVAWNTTTMSGQVFCAAASGVRCTYNVEIVQIGSGSTLGTYVKGPGFVNATNTTGTANATCRTLGTVMYTDANGTGYIGCDIEVSGPFDLNRSYCISQTTLRRESLVPDVFGRLNRYFATLRNLRLDEEVKVFIVSGGREIECLPSLNKQIAGDNTSTAPKGLGDRIYLNDLVTVNGHTYKLAYLRSDGTIYTQVRLDEPASGYGFSLGFANGINASLTTAAFDQRSFRWNITFDVGNRDYLIMTRTNNATNFTQPLNQTTNQTTNATNQTTSQNTSFCSDSDGGAVYNIKGTVTPKDSQIWGSFADHCVTTTTVYEFMCRSDGTHTGQQAFCSVGCVDGRCANTRLTQYDAINFSTINPACAYWYGNNQPVPPAQYGNTPWGYVFSCDGGHCGVKTGTQFDTCVGGCINGTPSC